MWTRARETEAFSFSNMARYNVVFLPLLLFALYVARIEGSNVTVACGDHNMTVSLEKQKFPYLNVTMLHLRWSWCRAYETSTHLVLSTSLNDCGTTFTETEDLLIFTNEVQGDVQVQDSITRDHDFDLQFNCSYSRKQLLGLSFIPNGIYIEDEVGFGNFTFKLDIYKTSSYLTPYYDYEYPVTLDLNEDMYVQFSVESSADLVIMALNCRATKDGSFHSSPQYSIIVNGCVRDTTMVYQYSSSRSFQQFKIKTFRFFNDYEAVYFHCELLACYRNAPNSRCSRSCASSKRRRRGAEPGEDSEEIQPSATKTYKIRRGPVQFKEKIPQEAGDTGENKQAAVIGGAAAAGGVGLLALIALVVLAVKYRIARLIMNRNKVGDLYATQDEQLSRRNAYIQDDDTIEKEGSMRDVRQ